MTTPRCVNVFGLTRAQYVSSALSAKEKTAILLVLVFVLSSSLIRRSKPAAHSSTAQSSMSVSDTDGGFEDRTGQFGEDRLAETTALYLRLPSRVTSSETEPDLYPRFAPPEQELLVLACAQAPPLAAERLTRRQRRWFRQLRRQWIAQWHVRLGKLRACLGVIQEFLCQEEGPLSEVAWANPLRNSDRQHWQQEETLQLLIRDPTGRLRTATVDGTSKLSQVLKIPPEESIWASKRGGGLAPLSMDARIEELGLVGGDEIELHARMRGGSGRGYQETRVPSCASTPTAPASAAAPAPPASCAYCNPGVLSRNLLCTTCSAPATEFPICYVTRVPVALYGQWTAANKALPRVQKVLCASTADYLRDAFGSLTAGLAWPIRRILSEFAGKPFDTFDRIPLLQAASVLFVLSQVSDTVDQTIRARARASAPTAPAICAYCNVRLPDTSTDSITHLCTECAGAPDFSAK
ncbi:hypothetical protein DIPPA_63311, partial [Diplonema papillatum]